MLLLAYGASPCLLHRLLFVHKLSTDQLLQVPRLGLHSNTLSSALKSVAVAAVSEGDAASLPVTK